MKILDGKALAERMYEEMKPLARGRNLSLGIILVGENAASEKFIEEKKKRGEVLEIDVRTYTFPVFESTRSLRKKIADLVKKTGHDGYIIQLPLPEGINTQYILNTIPEAKDVDVLNQKSVGAFAVGRSKAVPPVVGAIQALLQSESIELMGKKIAVVGAGRLVGGPVALWLTSQDLPFTVLTYTSPDIHEELKKADIIISGAGSPGLIRGDMVKNGVALIDAGTAVAEGKVKGDVDAESLADHEGFLAPVPGGVGPLTVAYLFKNLLALNS